MIEKLIKTLLKMKLITVNLIDHSTGNAYITNTFEEDLTDFDRESISFDKVKYLFDSEFDLDLKESECSWGIITKLNTYLPTIKF